MARDATFPAPTGNENDSGRKTDTKKGRSGTHPAVPSPRFCFSNRPRTLSPPLVGALSLVEYLESEVRLKKSRAVLKELSPALGEAMVPGCEDDTARAARVARTGLRWRLHEKVHLDEPTARIHTAPSHGNFFGRLAVDSSAQQARATTCSTRSTGCLIEAFPVEPDGHCRSRMNPHAIALSTPRIVSGMRLGSASARARAPSRSLSARSQASVEREHFRGCHSNAPTWP